MVLPADNGQALVLCSVIGDRPFIASDKCMQKYAHCIVLCSLCTSGLYNILHLYVAGEASTEQCDLGLSFNIDIKIFSFNIIHNK